MNQRTAAGVLAGLSLSLIVSEMLVAVFGGFDPGWMLLFLSLYAGAVGLLFGLRTLADGRREEIESVSERRVRAKREGRVGDLLDPYGIDEEFVGRRSGWHKPVFVKPPAASAAPGDRPLDHEALKSSVMAYAAMAGGLESLRRTIEAMDEQAFGSMARKAGMAGVSRAQALSVVLELVSEQGKAKKADERPLSLSIDKESFDDYIRRCMSDPESCDDDEADSLSAGFDDKRSPEPPSMPPTDLSHDPKSVMSRLNRPGTGE